MRFPSIGRLMLLALTTSIFLVSCDEKEELTTEPISDYLPLTTGKYITYRLDSLVYTNFGRTTEIHKYQVKHQVDAAITDNLGRPSYRVYRFIRDSAGLGPWLASGSYFVTALPDQVELIEDNLRFIKLHLPISNGFTWKGNRYLPVNPYQSAYTFGNDDYMDDWDFYYDGTSGSFMYRNFTYSNVLTVEEANESFNIPVTSPSSYGYKSRAVERYSKNIGLVYREYELWDYQPNTGYPGGPYRTGFGITMWMIDHN